MQTQGKKPKNSGREWLWLGLLTFLLIATTLAYTWPLPKHFSQTIPYAFHGVQSYRIQAGSPPPTLIAGDHLQFYYWCWLLWDNLTGPSQLFTNPYEFNTFLSPGLQGVYALFPFSVLYVILRPLGPLVAYNLLIYLSFLLSGIFAYLLGRHLLKDRAASFLLALVFALLPLRTSEVVGGHLYGFVAFVLPLALWCLESAWQRSREGTQGAWLAWGAGAGAVLFISAFLDPHLIYYLALLLGAYVPLRILLYRSDNQPDTQEQTDEDRPWRPVLAAGLGLGLFALFKALRTQELHFSYQELIAYEAEYLLLTWTFWLLLSALVRALSALSLEQARRAVAAGLAPMALAPLYAVQFAWDIPRLGSVLLAILMAWGLFRLGSRLRPGLLRPRLAASPLLKALFLPALGLALGVAYLLLSMHPLLEPSQASAGRSLDEVRFFAPRLQDLFDPGMERHSFLGWAPLGLALAALAWLGVARTRRLRQTGAASLWAAVGVGFTLLCLGPNLRAFPLYEFLFHNLPYFNYPRVPGRLLLVGALFLGLLAAWLLKELRRRWTAGRPSWVLLTLVLLGLVIWGYWPPEPTGLSLASISPELEATITSHLKTGPRSDQRLLELPIWPGDAHQSSLYELTITATRALSVNGYSPLAPRRYEQEIYNPLESLNFGHITPQAWDTLRRLRVKLVSFHNDEQVFPYWLSAFPPALSRERLAVSGLFRPLFLDGTVFLFVPQVNRRLPAINPTVTSPVTRVMEVAWLQRDTGHLVEDRQASGWGLLFGEQRSPDGPLGPRLPQPAGNVALALAGKDRPGLLSSKPLLSFHPYRYPPGRYLARFRLRRGPGGLPGRIEIKMADGGPVLASRELTPQALPPDGRWHDVALGFALSDVVRLDPITHFYGASDLALNLVLINFAGQEKPAAFYPASRLWRQTGALIPDYQVSSGLAVLGRANRDPQLYLMYGPQQTYPPGRYRARFRLAAPESSPPRALLAELVVATDLGRRPLGHALVRGRDLGPEYKDIPLEFVLKRRCELGLRVLYRQGGALKLAGASIERLD